MQFSLTCFNNILQVLKIKQIHTFKQTLESEDIYASNPL